MTILVVGASGATGKLVVEQLLGQGLHVRAIVRSPEKFPHSLEDNESLTLIKASLLELSDEALARHVQGCEAVVSCLGHNINLKGIYGQPRRLVTEAARRLCNAIKVNKPEAVTKYVLMNTTGNRNRDLHEPVSTGHRMVIGLLRLMLPPQVDNEQAADYLRITIGQKDDAIEWVAVRPDGLTDEEQVTEYEVHPSPIRSPIFNPGKTSRINVAHFMADLITNEKTWNRWKGQMPVIYNTSSL